MLCAIAPQRGGRRFEGLGHQRPLIDDLRNDLGGRIDRLDNDLGGRIAAASRCSVGFGIPTTGTGELDSRLACQSSAEPCGSASIHQAAVAAMHGALPRLDHHQRIYSCTYIIL